MHRWLEEAWLFLRNIANAANVYNHEVTRSDSRPTVRRPSVFLQSVSNKTESDFGISQQHNFEQVRA